MCSLHAMQTPRSTSVLYAAPGSTPSSTTVPTTTTDTTPSSPPSSPDKALRFCTLVRDAFTSQSLLVPDERPLKLHATLVNTLHARPRPRRAKAKAKAAKLPEGWGRPKARQQGVAQSRPVVVVAAASASSVDGTSTATVGGEQGMDEDEKEEKEEVAGGEAGVAGMDGNGKIDARWLIERWRDHVWAEVTVDRVAICEMGAKEDANGEVRYKEVAMRLF